MKKAIVSIFTVLSYLIMFSYWSLGGVSYVWSLYIAYQESGIMGTIITLFLPVIGQVYWVYRVWSEQGFESMFVFVTVAAVVTYIISLLLMLLLSSLSKSYIKDEDENEITDDVEFKYGFGGWLYLLIITQMYSVYITSTGIGGWFDYISSDDISTIRANGYNDVADRFAILGLSGIIYSLFLVLTIVIGWFFALRLSRYYKTVNIIMIVGNFLCSLFIACFMSYMNKYTEEALFDDIDMMKLVVGSIIFGLIWMPYFLNSKRIANTFTR